MTNNSHLATPSLKNKQNYRIRQPGTSIPHGYNGMTYFQFCSTFVRRRHSHGHGQYTSHTLHDVSFNELMPFIQK